MDCWSVSSANLNLTFAHASLLPTALMLLTVRLKLPHRVDFMPWDPLHSTLLRVSDEGQAHYWKFKAELRKKGHPFPD